MKIGGIQKTTLLDYPDKLAAVIFTQGCNFRCSFCYNRELVEPSFFNKEIEHSEIFDYLKKRRNVLDGVVITGGEPTIYRGLEEFIRKVKDMGLLVKLDSNGTNPEVLAELMEKGLLDHIAMDIKGPLERYKEIVNWDMGTGPIKKSIDLLMSSKIDHEFRSTIVPGLHVVEDIKAMGELIRGAKKWYLQKFMYVPSVLDDGLKGKYFTDNEMQAFREIANDYVDVCEVRG